MDTPVRTLNEESLLSAVSWGSVIAGAVAACALTLILMAFGAGLGFSSISPWSDQGVSATTFKIGTGIYLIVVAVMASAVGGYLAARLRSRWVSLNNNEVFFRDTAHGFIAWALATLLLASVLSGAGTAVVGGFAHGLGMGAPQAAAQASGPADAYVDRLLRPADSGAIRGDGSAADTRGELSRILTGSFRDRRDISAADRTYLARVVAARTGLSQADAERRVNEVITEAKQAVDNARRAAAQLALWMAAAMLFGAFAAALAAIEGGQLRDGSWEGRILRPRAID